MIKLDFILKIGGSVLTDKQQSQKFYDERILEICKNLKQLYDRGMKFVIVTGVGNVGHQAVFKYALHKGDDGTLERRVGTTYCQVEVNKLRNLVLQKLFEVGIPAMQFYTSSIGINNKFQPMSLYLDPLEHFSDKGIVPITSGDLVVDSSVGFSLMSGDVALQLLAIKWKPRLIAYGTNVTGIFSSDPQKTPTATLFEHIKATQIAQALQSVTEGSTIDVSGAMKGKFTAILNILKNDPTCIVHVFDLTNPANLLKLVANQEFRHTVISGNQMA